VAASYLAAIFFILKTAVRIDREPRESREKKRWNAAFFTPGHVTLCLIEY
jgi:hypothetical protein